MEYLCRNLSGLSEWNVYRRQLRLRGRICPASTKSREVYSCWRTRQNVSAWFFVFLKLNLFIFRTQANNFVLLTIIMGILGVVLISVIVGLAYWRYVIWSRQSYPCGSGIRLYILVLKILWRIALQLQVLYIEKISAVFYWNNFSAVSTSYWTCWRNKWF